MDILGQEEIPHLGFLGIFKKSLKIIFSWWKKIFFQITLALILPLSFIVFAETYLSTYFGRKILKHNNLRDYVIFLSLDIAYIIGILFLLLFSISAVTLTTAYCIYIAKEITFKRLMRVVLKVWKRLVITFLWMFLITLAYNIVAAILFVLSLLLLRSSNSKLAVLGIAVAIILVILYVLVCIYVNVIWNLASVISVLEDNYGRRALKKSRVLVKGKLLLNSAIFVTFQVFLIGMQVGYAFLVALGGSLPVVIHVLIGIVCFLLVLKLTLLSLVVQSVLYLVCKSHHDESIDKSLLDDQLEGYLGNYSRLGRKGREVKLGQLANV